MSAFVVGDSHIDYLLAAGLKGGARSSELRWFAPGDAKSTDYQRGEVQGPTALASAQERIRYLTEETITRTGHMLKAENRRSVGHRYDTKEPADFYRATWFQLVSKPTTPVQTLKAIACYEYQSCEHAEWEQSEAKAFCDALTKRMISKLPGYEEAAWEIRPGERCPQCERCGVLLTGTVHGQPACTNCEATMRSITARVVAPSLQPAPLPAVKDEPEVTEPFTPFAGKVTTHCPIPGRKDEVSERATHKADVTPGISIRLYGTDANNRDHSAREYDRTYRIGDSAEYGSYNLSYMGKITAIGPRSVTIHETRHTGSPTGTRHVLTLNEFDWRNWDGIEKKIKNNSEWSD